MAKRLSMILAGALLSTGVALAQSQVTGTGNYSAPLYT